MLPGQDSTPDGVTVAITDSLVIAANARRKWLILVNQGANDIWLSLGSGKAVADKGVYLKAGGGAVLFDTLNPWLGEIRGIADTVPSKLTIQEVEDRT